MFKKIKKIMPAIVLLLSLVFILGASGALTPILYHSYPIVNLVVNGEAVVPADVPAFQIDGRTVVPIRVVAEALKANVTWDEETRTVTISKVMEPIPVPPTASEDLITIKNVDFIGNKTKIGGMITNNNTEEVDIDLIIDCYTKNEKYLGHVHVSANIDENKSHSFQVEAEDELRDTSVFKVKIHSLKIH